MKDSKQSTIQLRNTSGLEVDLIALGARIQAVRVPSRAGPVGVVLGYADAFSYQHDPYFMGATIGRMAGRICNGAFVLNGQTIQLETQADQYHHCLHGGSSGFHSRRWQIDSRSAQSVSFQYHSRDGEGGFPSDLVSTVRYSLRDDMKLVIELQAVPRADTVLNLTNHAYFNLSGEGSVDRHTVSIHASQYTPLDDESIPTGEIKSVAGTEYDFRQPVLLADRLAAIQNGFDHNFVLDGGREGGLENGLETSLGAEVFCAETRIGLKLFTSQPSIQFYTGQFLDRPFSSRQGLCLEAQRFPDAPNQPHFPLTLVRARDTYREVIVYEFEVD